MGARSVSQDPFHSLLSPRGWMPIPTLQKGRVLAAPAQNRQLAPARLVSAGGRAQGEVKPVWLGLLRAKRLGLAARQVAAQWRAR
jgi:hypothetical protein